MKNKKDNCDPIDNLEYEKVLEEEIINSYESKFQKDAKPVSYTHLTLPTTDRV